MLRLVQEQDSDSDSDASTVDGVKVALQNSDGTVTSAQQHELAIAAEMAKQPAWFGGGRFSGREGKMARIRQQEALAAAKLGLALPKVSPPPASALPPATATATATALVKTSKKHLLQSLSVESKLQQQQARRKGARGSSRRLWMLPMLQRWNSPAVSSQCSQ